MRSDIATPKIRRWVRHWNLDPCDNHSDKLDCFEQSNSDCQRRKPLRKKVGLSDFPSPTPHHRCRIMCFSRNVHQCSITGRGDGFTYHRSFFVSSLAQSLQKRRTSVAANTTKETTCT